MSHFVYFLMNGDEVVYVGCTSNLKRRLLQHKDKPFNDYVSVEFDSKTEALRFESRKIRELAPICNIEHMPKHECSVEFLRRMAQMFTLWQKTGDCSEIKKEIRKNPNKRLPLIIPERWYDEARKETDIFS